jgi:hypothetical protein
MNSGILPATAMNKRRLGALSGCERKAHGGTQGQNFDGRSVARHRPNGGFSFVPRMKSSYGAGVATHPRHRHQGSSLGPASGLPALWTLCIKCQFG